MNWAIRVHTAYNDISGICEYLAKRSNVVVCNEHSSDTGTGSRTHIHITALACTVASDSIYTKLTSLGAPKGQGGRSCKDTYKTYDGEIRPVDISNVVYTAKGKLEPCFLHGINLDEYYNLRSQWVDYSTGSGTQGRQKKSVEGNNEITDFKIYLEIMDVLRTVPYKCECGVCRYDNQVATEHGVERKIMWTTENEHMHVNYACQVICNVRRKYHRRTPERLENEYMYQIYNDGEHMNRDRCAGYAYKHRRANPHLYAQYN